jgi:hypothetical protein
MDDPLENFIMPEINLDDFEAYEIHRVVSGRRKNFGGFFIVCEWEVARWPGSRNLLQSNGDSSRSTL